MTQRATPADEFMTRLKKTSFTWLLVRGVLGVLMGLLLLMAPLVAGGTIGVFVVVTLAVWLIFDGGASCALALRDKRAGTKGWGWALAGGIAAIVAGLFGLIFPLQIATLGGLALLWFLAIGMVVRGILEIGDRRLGGWGIALGVVNVLFGIALGILILAHPAAALAALIWVSGVYALVFGVMAIVLAVKIRKA